MTALTDNRNSFRKLEILNEDLLAPLDPQKIPRHIAIIPDGNRRWAKKNQFSIQSGHWKGADTLIDIIKAAKDIGIQVVTVYGFSTENNSRSNVEVEALMLLMEHYLIHKRQEMVEGGIRCRAIGDLETLPNSLVKALQEAQNSTSRCQDIDFVIALNYGSRDEIKRAVHSIALACQEGRMRPEQITEECISLHLDTAPWPDPDLLIRTSGEMRMSNFLTWQGSYTEFYSVDTYWPDFSPASLVEAVAEFQRRQRRLGM